MTRTRSRATPKAATPKVKAPEPTPETPVAPVAEPEAPAAAAPVAEPEAAPEAAPESSPASTEADAAAEAASDAPVAADGGGDEGAAPGVKEVKPEVPFGLDPDDAEDGDEATSGDPGAPPSGVGVTALYRGLRNEPSGLQPVATTVTVPEDLDEGYDGIITKGTDYLFRLNVGRSVREEHVGWLTKHPHWLIEVED